MTDTLLVVEDCLDLVRAEFGESCIHLRRTAQDVPGIEVVLAAIETTDNAAGFAND